MAVSPVSVALTRQRVKHRTRTAFPSGEPVINQWKVLVIKINESGRHEGQKAIRPIYRLECDTNKAVLPFRTSSPLHAGYVISRGAPFFFQLFQIHPVWKHHVGPAGQHPRFVAWQSDMHDPRIHPVPSQPHLVNQQMGQIHQLLMRVGINRSGRNG